MWPPTGVRRGWTATRMPVSNPARGHWRLSAALDLPKTPQPLVSDLSGGFGRGKGFEEMAQVRLVLRSKTYKTDAISKAGLHTHHLPLQVQLGFSEPKG